jgi:hypothetical protein
VSGQAPCSGAKRRGKGLDEVSSAILGDAVAENKGFSSSVKNSKMNVAQNDVIIFH